MQYQRDCDYYPHSNDNPYRHDRRDAAGYIHALCHAGHLDKGADRYQATHTNSDPQGRRHPHQVIYREAV